MSHTASFNGFSQIDGISIAMSAARAASKEQTALYLIVYWTIIGTMTGALVHQIYSIPGLRVADATILSNISGAVTGATLGQLTGMLLHVVGFNALAE